MRWYTSLGDGNSGTGERGLAGCIIGGELITGSNKLVKAGGTGICSAVHIHL